MLMVVFGAGASYDSYSTVPPGGGQSTWMRERRIEERRFPLAKDLFDVRGEFLAMSDRFPAMKPLLPYLRRPPSGESLEAFLARLQSRARPQRQEQLTAMRYYLQSAIHVCEQQWRVTLLHDETNQLALLEQIEEWRHGHREEVWLVTFNYDTMLEMALRHYLERPIQALEHYVGEGQAYKLIKLHGSIHWYRELESGPDTGSMTLEEGAGAIARATSSLSISDRYYCHPNKQASVTFRHDGRNSPVYPAIAIPVLGKQAFECPPDHVAALEKALPEIDRVILIGWRGAEEHFLELLRKHVGKAVKGLVVAATDGEAREIGERVGPFLPKGSDFQPRVGFTATLLAHDFRKFLDETS